MASQAAPVTTTFVSPHRTHIASLPLSTSDMESDWCANVVCILHASRGSSAIRCRPAFPSSPFLITHQAGVAGRAALQATLAHLTRETAKSPGSDIQYYLTACSHAAERIDAGFVRIVLRECYVILVFGHGFN